MMNSPLPQRRLLPVLIALAFTPAGVWANPSGATVVNGQATFNNQGNVLTVTNTPGAIIHWDSFSIGSGETTRFVQQTSNSAVMNRITGQDPSQILGTLESNGRVFLLNPNGVVFGQGSRVDVNGLVASSLHMSDADFLAGRMRFQAGGVAGDVRNAGAITTPTGGQVYLVGANVENSGVITSDKGQVILAAGHTVQLVDSSQPDVQVVVSAPENAAVNLGTIIGQSAKVGIYGGLVKQRGVVNANSAVVGENGRIVFKASQDTVVSDNSVTTATGAGTGGTVHVLGARVGVVDNAVMDASGQQGGGEVLVGGDVRGENAAITNSTNTVFGVNATIKADAISHGDGGKVVIWSDNATRAYGQISAKGGAQSGNGGFVEVSGKQWLDFHAKVDVQAPQGKAGTLLLDPAALLIVAGVGDGGVDGTTTFQGTSGGTGSILFADAVVGGASTLYQSELESIAAGTNIVLEAIDTINVSGAFLGNTITLSNNSNLTMRTRNAVPGGGMDLMLGAGGSLTIVASGTGSLTFLTGTDSSPEAAHIVLPNLQTAGGYVHVAGTGNVTANQITTAGGDIKLGAGSNGTVAISQAISGGDIELRADNLSLTGVVTSPSMIAISPFTPGRNIVVGSSTSCAPACLNVYDMYKLDTPTLAIGSTNASYGAGNISVQGITDTGATEKDRHTNTTRIGLLATGTVSQSASGAIDVQDLGVEAGGAISLGELGNAVTNFAAKSDSSVSFGNSTAFTVDSFSGGSGIHSYSLGGVTSTNSTISLVTGSGNIAIAADVSGGTGAINITAGGGGSVAGAATITGGTLTVNAGGGIAINTDVQVLIASNAGASSGVTVNNAGALNITALTQSATGLVDVSSAGAMVVSGNVSGAGDVTLTALPMGSPGDTLTITSTGSVTATGDLILQAGDAIVEQAGSSVTGATITRVPFMNASNATVIAATDANQPLTAAINDTVDVTTSLVGDIAGDPSMSSTTTDTAAFTGSTTTTDGTATTTTDGATTSTTDTSATTTGDGSTTTSDGSTSSDGSTQTEAKKDEPSEEKKDSTTQASASNGKKKDEPAKKMYCN